MCVNSGEDLTKIGGKAKAKNRFFTKSKMAENLYNQKLIQKLRV